MYVSSRSSSRSQDEETEAQVAVSLDFADNYPSLLDRKRYLPECPRPLPYEYVFFLIHESNDSRALRGRSSMYFPVHIKRTFISLLLPLFDLLAGSSGRSFFVYVKYCQRPGCSDNKQRCSVLRSSCGIRDGGFAGSSYPWQRELVTNRQLLYLDRRRM